MKIYKRTGFWLILIALAALGFLVYTRTHVTVEVKTQPVERRDFALTVTATSTGTIRADTEVKITAQRTGRLSSLPVVEGDILKAGDTIAEIDPVEARLNLELAEAARARARASLQQMRASYEAFQVEVETGIEKAQAELKEVRTRHQKLQELQKKGFFSDLDMAAVQREYQVAESALQNALSRKSLLQARKDEIRAQRAAVREAGKNLELARLTYQYSFIKAPISGIVTERPVDLGQTVTKGTLVAAMISPESLYIESFVDEADVGKVRVGQPVRVTMDAYPGRIFRGEVYRISPVVTGGRLESRTFEVRTRLKDPTVVLKTGMSADTEIVVETVQDALVIESQAVVDRDGKKFVYVKDGDRAALREVTVGLSDWTHTQVLSGLSPEDVVIVNPDVPGLKAGARVRAEG
jgi:HlyD family secretion protein